MAKWFLSTFPWIIFPLIGFVIGRQIMQQKIRQQFDLLITTAIILIVVGTTIACISLLLPFNSPVNHHLAAFSFYPDSTAMLLLQLC